jgi:transposase
MANKYRVTLNEDERRELDEIIHKGKGAARRLTRARILFQADEARAGPHETDEQIVAALRVGLSTVYRVRQAFVERGLDAALERRKPTGRLYRKLDGAGEARLVALACSQPPVGRTRWTLQLLADQLVELKVVDTISDECVRATLKKTTCSRTARNTG